MSLRVFKKNVQRYLSNIPGWSSKRKLIVFESDDWGSIRMPSKTVFESLRAKGLDLASGDAERYNLYDSLASKHDLAALFDVLILYKDKNGKAAVFTPVSIVANPDFEKIKQHAFKEYFYEPFTKTLERYYGNADAFKLWKEGINQNIFVPQFHAREHLNIAEWMRALQSEDKQTHLAFDHGFWGFNNQQNTDSKVSYQAAFDLYNPGDLSFQAQSIKEGLFLFEQLFGYRARFFVPPNGPFNNTLEKIAAAEGIQYMSVSKIQREPQGNEQFKTHLHYLGQRNKFGQTYLTRNCFFEPSDSGRDWVSSCLNEIETAFRWRKPAVISTHRVNYIGALNPKNRDKGLAELKLLLSGILKNWPDAEFLTSVELGDLITVSKN